LTASKILKPFKLIIIIILLFFINNDIINTIVIYHLNNIQIFLKHDLILLIQNIKKKLYQEFYYLCDKIQS